MCSCSGVTLCGLVCLLLSLALAAAVECAYVCVSALRFIGSTWRTGLKTSRCVTPVSLLLSDRSSSGAPPANQRVPFLGPEFALRGGVCVFCNGGEQMFLVE